MSAADFATILTSQDQPQSLLTKRARRGADGHVVLRDYDKAYRFDFSTADVADLTGLAAVLDGLSPHQCIVRGRHIAGAATKNARRLIRPRGGDAPTLEPVGHRWVPLDIDAVDCPSWLDPVADPEGAVDHVVATILPAELHDTDVYWQLTGGAGIKPGIRLRLVFWCDREVTDAELRRWLAACGGVDLSIFSANQPIYFAKPLFDDGVADPVARRAGIKLGQRPVAAIPRDIPAGVVATANGVAGVPTVGYETWCRRIGDHPAGEGFFAPIKSSAASWVASAGASADTGWLRADLEQVIRLAPRDRGVHDDAYIEKRVADLDTLIAHLVEMQQDDEARHRVEGATIEDFWAYLPQHDYIFAPTRQHWPAVSVNARLPSVPLLEPDGTPTLDGKGKLVRVQPAVWLDRNRSVEQMTWAPGEPEVVRGRLLLDGGWIERPGGACFNRYVPPVIRAGDPARAAVWVEHVRRIYPECAEHIFDWFAHRAQRPAEKINHAVVLGGEQGIGKDTMVEPLKEAIGRWNFQEASPTQVLDEWNGFLKAVVLRISEARDLGEWDRFKFHDHMKAYTASPPDVLRVNEKHLRQYPVPNVCGVIITTNHKNDGIYLDPDDRRHFVAWSNATKEEFPDSYWRKLWEYFAHGGLDDVATWLRQRDISGFNAKAPPPKTEAWRQIVNANRPGEESELEDIIDRMDGEDKPRPKALTLNDIRVSPAATPDFADWLNDRRNRRVIPHRLEKCGYEAVHNPDAKDGLWKFKAGRQTIYARKELSLHDKLAAAKEMIEPPGLGL